MTTVTNDLLSENELNIYPNPSEELVFIDYTLQESATVRMTIYDALGRKMESLILERQATGQYQLEWHGDQHGVYFLEVVIEEKRYVERLVILE